MKVDINVTEVSVYGNKVHLCESCKCDYPECQSMGKDVLFGDGIGNDNICCCAYYEPIERKKQGEVTE